MMPKEEKRVGKPVTGDAFVIENKICPPHQWFYQDVVDKDGAIQGQKMTCKVCGPLNTDGGR